MLWVNKHAIDIGFFLIVVAIALIFSSRGLLSEYMLYFLLFLHIFVVALILRFTSMKASSSQCVDFVLFAKENKNKPYYATKRLLLLNRQRIFPTVLVLYMTYLLIGNTKLGGLDATVVWLFLGIYKGNVLLGLTILSGIGTIFQETTKEKYSTVVHSLTQTKQHLALTVVLSTLAVYVIFVQTQGLGVIAYPISSISGILLFLIGVMILEDAKSKNTL